MAHIGIVSQETYLFHATIAENLRYAKPDATDAELEAAARAANIHETIASFPEVRHGRRRARVPAVGRREAAHRDRSGAAEGSGGARARRGDERARHGLASASCRRLSTMPREGARRSRSRTASRPWSRPTSSSSSSPGASSSRARTPSWSGVDGVYASLYRQQEQRPVLEAELLDPLGAALDEHVVA